MTSAPFAEREMSREARPVVELRGISKSFGATAAVAGVDLALFAGEVHGLVGENGAGKSTLMRILAGFFPDHGGTILLDGQPEELASPAQARAHGIILVHQELSLLPELSIAENILLGREPPARLRLFISHRETVERARHHLQACGVRLDPGIRVERLSIAERQLVEIVKGVAAAPRILILDEPTSSLSTRETRDLFGILSTLRGRRTAMVYISHKLDEIFATCQRATVLRDGRKVAAAPIEEWSEASLVRAMVGRDLSALFPRTFGTAENVRLAVEGLERHGRFQRLSFTIRSGEILGLYGMVGAGRTALAEALFGLHPAHAGAIHLNGRLIHADSPAHALRAGIAMVPEDRRVSGLVPMLSVRENMSLGSLPLLSRFGFVDRRAERVEVGHFLRTLLVRAASPQQEVAGLSGGNQQKVVIGRSLMPRPKFLILDEPTRGIDVVAKAEVHASIDRLAREGLAVLLISSELPEILGMCDRVLVMREGALVGSVARRDASEERLVALAAGAGHGE